MRKRRIIPTLPVDFFEDATNKVKYQKMLYSSILDGVEQTIQNGKTSFIMARVNDGKNVRDISILKDSFKSNLETCLDFYEQVSENYGIDEEGLGALDDEGVSIPRSTISLSEEQISQLHQQINPTTDDRNFGIDLYQDVVAFLHDNLQ